VSTPVPDLGRLKIDRDGSLRGARRGPAGWAAAAAVTIVVLGAGLWLGLRGKAPLIGAASATLIGGGEGGSTGVVANGYVVARTQASVSAKLPGRLAFLGVSEGSQVRQGQVIARLENARPRSRATRRP
jgi:multidrug efflux pump subunit AcrA (membrane-fusion protein)